MPKTWVDPWVRNILWRRKWHPTPVFLSGKFYGQRSLAVYSGVTKGRMQLSNWGHTPQNQDKDHRGPSPLGAAIWASPVAHMVNNLPAIQKTWIRSLGLENPLEEEMATQSSILAWRTPWTEESGGLQSMGSQRVGHDWVTDKNNNKNTIH